MEQKLIPFKVNMGNLVVGKLSAFNITDAERIAQETHGPTATVTAIERWEPVGINEMLDDFEGREMPLMIIPDYEVKTFSANLHESHKLDEYVNGWLRHNRGIRVTETSRFYVPSMNPGEVGKVYQTITFYHLIQFPMRRTAQELMGKGILELTPEQLKGERKFMQRLTTDLASNHDLFAYAATQEVDWMRKGEPIEDRTLCIQAIRRARGWLK